MQIVYDVATKLFAFDTEGANTRKPYGDSLKAGLNRHGITVQFLELSFGASVFADGVETHTFAWPETGQRFTQSDQDVLVSVPVSWLPAQEITITAWLENAGHRAEGEFTFIAPIPQEDE